MDKVIINISTEIAAKVITLVLKRVRFGVCHGNRNVTTFKLKSVTIVEKSVLEDVVVFRFAFYGDEMSLVMRLLTILLCVYPIECVVGKLITRTHVFRESRWATWEKIVAVIVF